MIKLKPSEFKFLIKLAEQGLESECNCLGNELVSVCEKVSWNKLDDQPSPALLINLAGQLETLAKNRMHLARIKSGKQSV